MYSKKLPEESSGGKSDLSNNIIIVVKVNDIFLFLEFN
jgi:hypothetical protein